MIHRPKKSLGQNFLINPKVAERIAFEANISEKDIVLEIGPGTGKLTKFLLPQAKKVIAVEKDDNLAKEFVEKFKNEIAENKLVLIKGDVLETREDILWGTLGRSDGDGQRKFSAENFRGDKKNIFSGFKYKIVANIPYNITGAILKKFLSAENKPESMILMIQKEVAERIMARDGKESLLSISVKAYGAPEVLFKVSRGNFFPIPNVDSAVIAIKNISGKIFMENKLDEEQFWEIVRAGFAHKRKKLSSNLKTLLKYGEIAPTKTLGNKRAEELSLADWINLAKAIDINKKE
jgi:16S rRNA (adenine1518-N6/adenine1519-N6)-dimethyltransferase